MPGLVGFISKNDDSITRGALGRQRDMLTRDPGHVKDDIVHLDDVWASRVHLGLLQPDPQPVRRAGMNVWMDGEIHNRSEVAAKFGIEAGNDLDLLAALVERDPSFAILGELDGFFAAVIHDPDRRRLMLISDRYGLRHMFWSRTRDGVAWSSEIKTFLELPGFSPTIDRVAVRQFTEIGYQLADRTWFEGVHLLDSGTVLEVDLGDGAVASHRYWWWDQIQPRDEHVVTDELVDELHDRFQDAVARRCADRLRIGMTLSGGLDSRAILASLPARDHPIHAVTFGIPTSDEMRLAGRAAAVRGAVHHPVIIDASNWLQDRIAGVWCTDGQLDLMHMHGIEALQDMGDHFDVNLSGYSGDLIAGGSYLFDTDTATPRVRRDRTAAAMGCTVEDLEGFDACLNHPSTDIYFLQNRVRRFTYGGTRFSLDRIATRKPFFDRQLIDFVYALPDHLRRNGVLYHTMLLKHHPEYFRTIPYAAYGVPLGSSRWSRRAARMRRRVLAGVRRQLGSIGRTMVRNRSCTDYRQWLQHEPARGLLLEMLDGDDAAHREYLPGTDIRGVLHGFLQQGRWSPRLTRYLTLELWLRQVHDGQGSSEDIASRIGHQAARMAA